MGVEINLEGKVALVTGASRGIGEAVAKKLAQAGADIALNSTPNSVDQLGAVANEIQGMGHRSVAISGDLSISGFAASLVDRAVEAMGRLDILVHNAGIVRDNLLVRMKPEEWYDVMRTNLDSGFFLSQDAIKQMRQQRSSGNILFISSVVAHGHAGQANYAASKSGLEGLMRSIADEYAANDDRRIRSNAIACALVDTDMGNRLTDKQKEAAVDRMPIGRIIKADEVANTALFLVSDFSSPITGAIIDVDGGLLRR